MYVICFQIVWDEEKKRWVDLTADEEVGYSFYCVYLHMYLCSPKYTQASHFKLIHRERRYVQCIKFSIQSCHYSDCRPLGIEGVTHT